MYKKNLILTIIISYFFIACGSSNSASKKYDLWDYMINDSTNNITYTYDYYEKDENGTIITTILSDHEDVIIQTNDTIKHSDGNSTFALYDDKIIDTDSIDNETKEFKRFFKTSDIIAKFFDLDENATAILKANKIHDTFKLYDGYKEYANVLELESIVTKSTDPLYYDNAKFYFAKGIGFIGNIDKNCKVPYENNRYQDNLEICIGDYSESYSIKQD